MAQLRILGNMGSYCNLRVSRFVLLVQYQDRCKNSEDRVQSDNEQYENDHNPDHLDHIYSCMAWSFYLFLALAAELWQD